MPLYEVIVVGLGAVGSAAIRHLARLGAKVLGIDRYKPPHEFGSSTGETRLTRAAVGEGVEYSPLALRSNEIWREIETTTGQTLFVQCGCLTITGHPNKSMVHGVNKFFDNIVASAERFNIPHEIFRSADALRSRFPQFAVNEAEIGFLDKGGGYLFVEACIRTSRSLYGKNQAVYALRCRKTSLSGWGVEELADELHHGRVSACHSLLGWTHMRRRSRFS